MLAQEGAPTPTSNAQVRSQRVLMLHVQPAGRMVALQSIGETCYADDELVLGRAADAEARWQQRHAEGVGWASCCMCVQYLSV